MTEYKLRKKRKSTTIFGYYLQFFITIYIVCSLIFSVMLFIFVSDYWKKQKYEYMHDTVDLCVSLFNHNNNELTDNSEDVINTLKHIKEVYNTDVFITSTETTNAKILYCFDSENGETVCEKHKDMTIPSEYITSTLSAQYYETIDKINNIYNQNNFIVSEKITDNNGKIIAMVFAIQPTSEGFRPYVLSFVKIYITLFIIILFITCLVIYVISYTKFVKPMKILAQATTKFTEGEFGYRLNIADSGTQIKELENVQYSFNSMAESLEQLEKQRNSFIANVSHELKTPMTTIGGFIDGMTDGTIPVEDRDKYLKIISAEVKRLSRLVISMLNMSKIESGELRLNLTKFNLTEIIINIFLSFEQQIENKHITVKGLEKLKNTDIEADMDMINQVFYNLIDNAVKFTNFGGTIIVSEFYSNNDTVCVKIRNTGNGIKQKDLPHIFDRFFKADKSRSLDSKSAGLGLFLVNSIVKLHSGEISVTSIENDFTEFSVKLKVHLI